MVHIPHPPDHPVDTSRPRRIVRFKRPVSYQNITPEQFAGVVSSVPDNGDGIHTTAALEYLDPAEEVYQEPQSDPHGGPYIHPVDTLPGIMELSYGDVQPDPFVGYANPVDSLPGIVEQQMQPGLLEGYVDPKVIFPGILKQQTQPNPVLGNIHPVDTLPGILDKHGQPNPVFGPNHPVDTLPGIDNQPPDNGYNAHDLPFVALSSLKQDIYGEGFAGYPEIRLTGQLGSYGEARHQSKGRLAPIPSVILKNDRPRKSTQKQRPTNTSRKLISINCSVNV